jgi:exopolysaccharide production negative regulator
MRISSIASAVTVGILLGAGPSMGFDGAHAPNTAMSPLEAFRAGTRALKLGETDKAVTSLQYAADNGHALAQWKLGRMYAEGDGVQHNDLRAFDYFRRIVRNHADDNPSQPQARFVANAYVELGAYYLNGIPNSAVKADPARARDMFAYAASYFGDPDAQYNLGRLYLSGKGVHRDPRQAVRWLALAANKGHYQAQALLGRILFKGENVPRQRALGLMWLTLASDGSGGQVDWIVKARKSAFDQASEDDRALALTLIRHRISGDRDW